jgi:hypothetical protein
VLVLLLVPRNRIFVIVLDPFVCHGWIATERDREQITDDALE